MPLPYQVMRLFTSPEGHLVEISCRRRQASTEQPSHEWLWVTDQSVTTLRPRHSAVETQQVWVFREARLQLDGQHAELAWSNGQQLSLAASPTPTLPSEHRQLIHNHLS
ncbi:MULTISPECIES: hypothetical protein [unclassified Pseudomonas]|uniref:hypothetical protein n=1 Tax=unclassified Pseudomonas TaxID=196821 RepID=UPI000C88775E|nr:MULTISPECIES: hypothetical protein [unclassified Pseudomonas]PMX27622.1 hypothetical protein C1Y23_08150 [Pseudomonas sp. GW460-12]PMX35565.1 hypothetical protein C1Y24_09235 [Pseudomonas sp. MPR-R2A4]PMX42214.1 hypothetical protein C1Y26_07380 [Pseudomonas sp. MPR-R2A7]PMX53700.1 hypothetical protein C1Y17_12135 [Pseudomonas sp. MPR-R2A6]PMX90620.1 hypothetical protein C1Y21_15140 [Pseudomonas sp. MPR-R2A3]